MPESDNKLAVEHSQHGFALYDADGNRIAGKCWVDEEGVVHFAPDRPDRDPSKGE